MASLSGEENIASEDGTASDDITVHEVSKTKPFDATFSTQTWREDTTLIVQGNRLYVSSSILSVVSPVFTAMFEEAFGGDRPREIELKEKKHDDIVEFLLCIYPNIQKTVNSDNVCVVLPLAVEYDVPLLKDKCKDFLSSQVRQDTQLQDMCVYLNTACKCEMADIKEKYIQMLSDNSYSEVLKAEEKFPLPLDVKVEIQHRRLVFVEKSNEIYGKMLKKVELYKLCPQWFYDSTEIHTDFENGCVGYLEYSVCIPGKGKERESPAISVHGIDWTCRVQVSTNGKDLGFYQKATGHLKKPDWSCRVYAILTLRNNKTEDDCESKTFDQVFTEMDIYWGYPDFEKIDKLKKKQTQFLDNNIVHLEIKFIANALSFKGD